MTQDTPTELHELVRELSSEVGQFYRWVAEQAGLNQTDLFALLFVRSAEGSATPKLLSENLGLTSGATAILLNRLEARELIQRMPHPTDRRGVLLALGPAAARNEFFSLRQRLITLNADIIGELSPEEATIVRRFLGRMLSNTRDSLRQSRVSGSLSNMANEDTPQ